MLKRIGNLVLSLCVIPTLLSAHFDLDDFRGAFLFYGYSNSGIEFNFGPEFPVSQTNISQVTFDRHGVGSLNFLSLSVLPFIGTISDNNCPPEPRLVTVKLNLLNKHTGSGNLIISGLLDPENVIVYDFVAKKRDGKVVKLVGHTNFGTTQNPICQNTAQTNIPPILSSLIFAERQED
jgi:hypothetical protein